MVSPGFDPVAFLADLEVDAPRALDHHGGRVAELAAMRGCPQPANHHAEGDVWAHTRLALAVLDDLPATVAREAGPALAAAGVGDLALPERTLTQAFAVLVHDIAKPLTIAGDEGAWTYHGHDRVGADLAAALLEREGIAEAATARGTPIDPARVRWLLAQHLFWLNTRVERVTDRAVARRFVRDDGWDEDLRVLAWCDTLGSRGPDGRPHVDLLVAAEVRLAATRRRATRRTEDTGPLLRGEDVMGVLGLPPGPRVGAVLAWLQRQEVSTRPAAQTLLQRRRDWLRTADERELQR